MTKFPLRFTEAGISACGVSITLDRGRWGTRALYPGSLPRSSSNRYLPLPLERCAQEIAQLMKDPSFRRMLQEFNLRMFRLMAELAEKQMSGRR
jgi:hypothetical protein